MGAFLDCLLGKDRNRPEGELSNSVKSLLWRRKKHEVYKTYSHDIPIPEISDEVSFAAFSYHHTLLPL